MKLVIISALKFIGNFWKCAPKNMEIETSKETLKHFGLLVLKIKQEKSNAEELNPPHKSYITKEHF